MSIVRQRQAPIRAQYQQHPELATITKRVRTGPGLRHDPFHGTVTPHNLADPTAPYGVQWRYGTDRAVGGLHDTPNPGEMLCGALAACADSTVRMIADLTGIELDELEVDVSGELDVRGTLLVDPAVPVGFQQLTVAIRTRPAAGSSAERIAQLATATEQCCVVLDTLRHGVPIDVTFESGAETTAPLASHLYSRSGRSLIATPNRLEGDPPNATHQRQADRRRLQR